MEIAGIEPPLQPSLECFYSVSKRTLVTKEISEGKGVTNLDNDGSRQNVFRNGDVIVVLVELWHVVVVVDDVDGHVGGG